MSPAHSPNGFYLVISHIKKGKAFSSSLRVQSKRKADNINQLRDEMITFFFKMHTELKILQ